MAGKGLGLSDFLRHTEDSGGGGQWLRRWRENGSGEITVWLHTKAPIVPSFSHAFTMMDKFIDRKTDQEVDGLRFLRFVSPDPEIVHKSQYFRDDNKVLKVYPDRDPFLLLREWLRWADDLALDEPIFHWHDKKERKTIVWERGELSGLVKRGKNNWNHSLDTKIEYVYVVVDNDDVDSGNVIAREGKLLSQKISEVIRHQQKMLGDDAGDPIQHPYAFLWMADASQQSPMNFYKCAKHEGAELTDEIWEHISSDEYPDPTPYGEPADGDMAKIRAAFEKAAQVELPLDEIFSDDPDVRKALSRPPKKQHAVSRSAPVSKPASEPAGKPATTKPTNGASAKPAAATQPAEAPAGRRRKKVEEPPPEEPEESEPEVETIACDDCGKQIPVTASKCECGAEYEVDEPAPSPPPKPATTTKPKPATTPKPTTTTASKPTTTSKAGAAKKADDDGRCWACGTDRQGSIVCPSCGVDQGDQLPF